MFKILNLLYFSFLYVVFFRRIYFKSLSFISLRSSFFVHDSGKIIFRGRFHIKNNVILGSSGLLTVGDKFSINPYSRIISKERIEIGDNVLIAQFVSILDHDHDLNCFFNRDNNSYLTSPIKIGDNVWIGDKVSILKGVTIGSNVIIGANSVVTKDIPSNSIIGGIPAHIIKKNIII